MTRLYCLLFLLIVFLNACTSIDYSRRETRQASSPTVLSKEAPKNAPIQPVHKNTNNQSKVITTAMVTQVQPVQQKKKSIPASRQAVLNLLEQSKLAMEQSQYAEAENLLARALRIEPSNAWLWHNMAVLNFYQEDYQQAIQQALKSNNLEKNNAQLKANNSKLIKQSYIEIGDFKNSQKYQGLLVK